MLIFCPGFIPSSLLKKIERETWRESGVSLIATVTRLMERLLDYRWAIVACFIRRNIQLSASLTTVFCWGRWLLPRNTHILTDPKFSRADMPEVIKYDFKPLLWPLANIKDSVPEQKQKKVGMASHMWDIDGKIICPSPPYQKLYWKLAYQEEAVLLNLLFEQHVNFLCPGRFPLFKHCEVRNSL